MTSTRRGFLNGAIGFCVCACRQSTASAGDENAPDESFVCLTEQLPAVDGSSVPQEIIDYLLNSATTTQLIPFHNSGQTMTFKPFQVMLKEDAWRPEDSLPDHRQGRTSIAVHFQDGTPEQRALVRSIASEWSSANAAPVDFIFDSGVETHVRVRFAPRNKQEAGQWSYVGRRAKRYPASEPTLMLEKCTRATILHEFGHALGLRHEQSHPLNDLDWNKPVVYQYYAEHHNWDRARVDSQIFKIYSASYICKGAPGFDRASVMIYPIRSEFLKSGVANSLSDQLSSGDKACVNRMYGAS